VKNLARRESRSYYFSVTTRVQINGY